MGNEIAEDRSAIYSAHKYCEQFSCDRFSCFDCNNNTNTNTTTNNNNNNNNNNNQQREEGEQRRLGIPRCFING
ncbi:uncharacterized protein Dwil_GK27413 [Drosophila willistoni]|uniref:Uncharacterized protein n=1 Tax=Drosophila willistoni TaxID=7260 RepID=A0A0Q9WPA9_DROWI|nr:uncharacterized protein Dwil_GK27413 [Drosophila willistoni]